MSMTITINITIDRSKCAKYGIDLNNVALEHLQIKDRFELTLEGLRTALVSRRESVSAYYYTAADEPDKNHVEILRSDIIDAYPEAV